MKPCPTVPYWGAGTVFLVSVVTAQTTLTCQDIDSSACQKMLAQKPDLCSDTALAKTACPRFCKLCPVECYHCNATVLDYHLCNTTMLCAEGQVCMRKELKSFVDGHHEYQMTCEANQICDGGSDLTIPFGKRNVESRDISVTCCTDDLCNYPGSLTTSSPTSSSGCPKDIVFLVDEVSNVASTQQVGIINAIAEVAKRLDIGVTDNLIGLYGYGDDIDRKFDLQQNTDKASLLSTLQSQTFRTHDRKADLHDAIQALVNHILQPRAGDRQGYPDAIVIIADSHTSHHGDHLGSHDQAALQKASQDIIFLSVGPQISSLANQNIEALATDSSHILRVSDMYTPEKLIDSLVALLLKC